MFREAFFKPDKKESARIISLLAPGLDTGFDPAKTTVLTHALSFYPGYFLAELSRHDQYPPSTRAVVYKEGGKTYALNWSNTRLYEMNKEIPVYLDTRTAPDYVRFYFHYVRSTQGRFLIVDSVDDVRWREEPAPAGRKALGKMIVPLTLERTLQDGTFLFTATFVFKDSLFQGKVHLNPDGTIILQDEELLVEGIPVIDDLYGQ
jgi:hypothetical protein